MLSDCLEGKKGELLLLDSGPTEAVARKHRDRRLQAILPLTCEVFQVLGAPLEVALDNEEFKSLIATFGGGISLGDFSAFLFPLRYGRVILAFDSDSSNAQMIQIIRQYFEPLFRGDHLFQAPPTGNMSESEFFVQVLNPETRSLRKVNV